MGPPSLHLEKTTLQNANNSDLCLTGHVNLFILYVFGLCGTLHMLRSYHPYRAKPNPSPNLSLGESICQFPGNSKTCLTKPRFRACELQQTNPEM
ncbi:hypothetical protein E2320_022639, partial [Naja naja]